MKNDKLLQEYQRNLRKGEEVFKMKYEEIKAAREAEKQIMPLSTSSKSSNSAYQSGNDSQNTDTWGQSVYEVPLIKAIGEKILQELTTNTFDHEFEGNTKEGRNLRRALKRQIRKILSLQNIRLKFNMGLWHAIHSGTFICQTITKEKIRKVISSMKNDDGTYNIEPINLGRIIDLIIYDPITVIPDPNARPENLKETMQWCIVTIGKFDREYVEKEYGVKLNTGAGDTRKIYDAMLQELEYNSGVQRDATAGGMVIIREYYKTNGMRYTVAGDNQIIDISPNCNGIMGEVPINFVALWPDPTSIFGQTLESLLRPSVDVIDSILNQIIDIQSMNANMPFLYDQSVMPQLGEMLTIGQMSPKELIPVDNVSMGGTQFDVSKAFGRLSIPEVTQGAMFAYEQCLKHIWFLTGFNEITLGGIQEKQIRNADVAGMIQSAALKNSSRIVTQIETCLMNPMSWDIMQILDMYYEDFPELKNEGITKEVLRDFKNIRVVNGSSLPSDQVNRLAKVEQMIRIGMSAPQSVNWEAILQDWFDALGVADESIYLLDSMQMLTENQAAGLLQMVEQQGIEAAMQHVQAVAQGAQ